MTLLRKCFGYANIIATLGVAITTVPWQATATPADNIPHNETPIVFTANSGESTDAYEGYLLVPENRNNPNSRKIRINYVRFPATNDTATHPIVYLAGGPGGSGIGTAKRQRFPLFQAMREFGDVIALDQRGTGASEQPDVCVSDFMTETKTVGDNHLVVNNYKKAVAQCFARWQHQGIDVYGYTSVQNALDLDDVRRHLNADKISLWGISYGSHLALTAMKLMPEYLDKVVIASVEGLDQTVKLPAQTDAYFQRVQEAINQTQLKQQVPDLAKLMRRVHNQLDKKPVPITIPLRDGTTQDILFQRRHMQSLASMMIADPGRYLNMLVNMYIELDNGGVSLVTAVNRRGMFLHEPIEVKLMSRAMDIASGITAKRLDLVEHQAATSLLGLALNFPMPHLDKLDPKLDLGDSFRTRPASDIPTLVLSGTLDGRTYPEEQKYATDGLSNRTLITVEHAGHNLFMSSPKVTEVIQAFMRSQKIDDKSIVLPVPAFSSEVAL